MEEQGKAMSRNSKSCIGIARQRRAADMRCIERQWIREAMVLRCLAKLGIGEAWTGRAAERQRKDVTCKGDEWPGNAAEKLGEETELPSNAMNRNS